MPRKLKSYQTSQGFYDLAIAAPSMKAALEAWGASSNHQGFAKEADDDKIITATMEKPGIILRRPVGSKEPFGEHSDLPTIESLGSHSHKIKEPSKKKHKAFRPKIGEQETRKAAIAFEWERERREKRRQREEAAAAKIRARRDAAVSEAEAALETAEQEHQAILAKIEKDRGAIERRAEAEKTRWDKVRERLRFAKGRSIRPCIAPSLGSNKSGVRYTGLTGPVNPAKNGGRQSCWHEYPQHAPEDR
jgi:colicin import membrane protein